MRSAPENVTPQELAALTTREREVIQAQLDGLNCAGISERLGTSRASVYVHASQARRRIAEMRLQPANDGAPDLWIAPEVSPWDSGDPASTATIARARLVAGRRDAGRSVTIAAKHLTREERRSVELVVYPDVERPRTRGDCEGLRPCPHCGQAVFMRVSPVNGEKRDIHRPDGTPLCKDAGDPSQRKQIERIGNGADVAGAMRLRPGEDSERSGPEKGRDEDMSVPVDPPRNVRDADLQRLDVDDPALHESQGGELCEPRSQGHFRLSEMDGRLRELSGRHGKEADCGSLNRSDRQQRQLRAGELPLGDEEGAATQSPIVSCPRCGGRVRYDRGVGGEDWSWRNYDQGAPREGVEPGASGEDFGLNHCRPCPYSSCSHHLYLDVSPIGSIKLNHPTREVWELAETCALDVADRGGVALEKVGEYLNLTRERVRQIEMSAARRAAESMPDEF